MEYTAVCLGASLLAYISQLLACPRHPPPLLVHAQSLHCVQLFATPQTVTYQVPMSMRFPRQKYQSELPFPARGDLPDPGIELTTVASPQWRADSFTMVPPGKPQGACKQGIPEPLKVWLL